MKKKTYLKNILRDMKDTKGKIISIFVMIFLASSVIVGLFLTGPTMRKTLEKTLKFYKHPDIIIRSTYGINSEDQAILENDEDIDHIYYAKSYDGLLKNKLLRLKSFNDSTKKTSIIKGSFPKNEDEIAIDAKFQGKYKIGEKLEFKSPNDEKIEDSLKNIKFKLVGFVKSSDYLFEDIRDVSITGKRMTEGFALINHKNFKKDIFSEANIYYKNTKNLDFFAEEYKLFINKKKKSIEENLDKRPEEVLSKIKKEANEKLDDSQDQIDKAESKLSQKEKELNNAKISIEKGFEDYNKNKEEFYIQLNEAQKDLDESKKKLEDGKIKLDQGKEDYEKSLEKFKQLISLEENKIKLGKDKIEKSQKELNLKKTHYEENLIIIEEKFKDQKNQLDNLENSLNSQKKSIENIEKLVIEDTEEYKRLKEKIENIDPSSSEYISSINIQNELLQKIDDNKSSLILKNDKYKNDLNTYKLIKEKFDFSYKQALSPLDNVKKEIEKNQNLLDIKKDQLSKSEKLLEDKKIKTLEKLDQAKIELVKNQKELSFGEKKYKEGIENLNKNKKEGEEKLKSSYKELIGNLNKYKEGKKEFDKNISSARKEISDGKAKIKEERNNIINLKSPIYDISRHKDNKAIKTYYNNSLNIDQLTKVFPTFFYFVAILVTLTTMKRYIEEQRSHVGVLKSLGYSNNDISNKFYIYGLIPTLLGAIFGGFFGKYILTKVIFKAYSTGFDVLDLYYYDSFTIIVSSLILSIVLIYFTILITNKKSLNEVTANLLRAKVPKDGSRILLEKIGFIWKRLSFLQKVTFRNIFRYKSRMYMTLFGVSGCTALLFFGFAMQDSIKDTSNIQKNQIINYNAIVIFDKDAQEKDKKSLNQAINNINNLNIIYSDANVEIDNKEMKINIMAFEEIDKVKEFIGLRDLKNNLLKIENTGAIITENIAIKNKLKVGDDLEFKDSDNKIRKLKIRDVAENYINDYIYISKNQHKKIFDENSTENASLIKINNKDQIKKLEKEKAVLSIIQPNSMYETIDVLMENLNLVIIIITLVSSLLAIVVLFNLTSINVSERIRELATTKVLGFYPIETTAYINRETFILTIIGILIGYALGYIMFRYILNVVAPEGILLAYHPHLRSFVYSAIITFIILLVIVIIIHRKLKKIDMAEAMKSAD